MEEFLLDAIHDNNNLQHVILPGNNSDDEGYDQENDHTLNDPNDEGNNNHHQGDKDDGYDERFDNPEYHSEDDDEEFDAFNEDDDDNDNYYDDIEFYIEDQQEMEATFICLDKIDIQWINFNDIPEE